MRVFVSSSFEDLREYRAAAIRVLRQLGHDVVAMEDMTAGTIAPLSKVIEMVDRSEAYVGIFAWRYGYIPPGPNPALRVQQVPIRVADATPGKTSITHYEYLRARQRGLPVLAFLLDESCAWPPRFVDGFDTTPNAPRDAQNIRALRFALQQERVVSWFTTPSDLEARVSAAITTTGLTQQLDLQPATALDSSAGTAGDSSAEMGIATAIKEAADHRALRIDLRATWWSTRLYLMAAMAERLTNVRRIVIINTVPPPPPPPDVQPPSGRIAEQFVGQISTTTILSTIHARTPALEKFELWLRDRSPSFTVIENEVHALLEGWRKAFGDTRRADMSRNEKAAKIDLSPSILRHWFGEAMLTEPVRIADLQRASVVDLLRLLDYPGEFVPVVTRTHPPDPAKSPSVEQIDVLDKTALNARLARSYLVELMDRARIS